MDSKKKDLTPEQKQECAALKALFNQKKAALGITQARAAEQLGIGQAAISHYLNGVNALNLVIARKFAQLLAIEVATFSPRLSDDAGRLGLAEPAATAVPAHASPGSFQSRAELSTDDYQFVDRYDLKLSAGDGTYAWVVREKDPLTFRSGWFERKGLSPQQCKAMLVRGRSMEPKLEDGDTVLIDTADTEVVDGDIYAVLYKQHLYIKTVEYTGGGLRLKSENREFSDIEIGESDLPQLTILGRKVWRGG